MKMNRAPTVVGILLLCLLAASIGIILSPLADYQKPNGYSVYPFDAGAEYDRSVPANTGKGVGEWPDGAPETDADAERKIIQRASLSIEVADFTASEEALIRAVERSNGYISDSYAYVT